MPIYEYQCGQCGVTFEELIRAARDEAHLACPQCGAKAIERRLSTFATHTAAARPAPSSAPCDSCCNPEGGCPWAQQ